jgi:hypothetical protein
MNSPKPLAARFAGFKSGRRIAGNRKERRRRPERNWEDGIFTSYLIIIREIGIEFYGFKGLLWLNLVIISILSGI